MKRLHWSDCWHAEIRFFSVLRKAWMSKMLRREIRIEALVVLRMVRREETV